MRLVLLTSLTMLAFAANSLLNRLAVAGGGMDPSSFAMIRVLSGALALCVLLALRRKPVPLFERGRVIGAVSLATYMIGFSLAYVSLDAGLGALILFGTVQVSMFGWSALRGTRPTGRQVSGAVIAFAGLLIALWPGAGASADVAGTFFMVLAGLGWAAYTLAGKGARDPLAATAANFVVALPLLALLLLGSGLHVAPYGVLLAILSGAVTSGLGYALWYTVLPQLQGQTAAVVQLSVPIIAILAGAILLSEVITATILLAAVLVLGGIALAVISPAPQAGRS